MNAITDFLKSLLTGVIDTFKTKNPVAFAIIAVALGTVFFLSETLTSAMLPDGTDLLNDKVQKVVDTIQGVLFVLMGLLGSHTPKVEAEE